MKRIAIIVIWALLLAFATCASPLEVPKLTGYVNDYAGMLSKEEAARISHDLELYESATSNQVFILTIPSLEGEAIEQYSIKVAESWKAGRKDKDNGIIITLAKAERKIRIEIGRGLEGSVTDLTSGRIIREEMQPRLKANKNAEALESAIAKIKLAAKGEYVGDGKTAKDGTAGSDGKQSGNEMQIKWGIAAVTFLVIAGIASCVHFVFGGIAGGIVAFLFGMFMFHLALTGLIIAAVVGFVLGMIAKELGYIGLNIGGAFLGGGGSFGGGGASGDW